MDSMQSFLEDTEEETIDCMKLDEETSLDMIASEEYAKANKKKTKVKSLTAFQEDDFESNLNINDNVTNIISTKEIKYSDVVKDYNNTIKSKVDSNNSNNRNIELAMIEDSVSRESKKHTGRNKLNNMLSSVKHIVKNTVKHTDNLNIVYTPNVIQILDLSNISVSNNKIVGTIGAEPISLEILGFTTNFECVIQVITEASIRTGGSTSIYKSGMNLYLLNEVEFFDRGSEFHIILNNIDLEIEFEESNHINSTIKGLPYYPVNNIEIF